MRKIKFLIILLLSLSFTILFSLYSIYHIEAQEFYKHNIPLSNNFVDIKNSKISVQIKYPGNWTVQYTKGTNDSKSFKGFSEMLEEEESYKNLSDFDKYQLFFKYFNTNCSFIIDCRFIKDRYFQSYMIDSKNLASFVSLLDYLPSLRFLSPIENSADNFLENVKIASFKLPYNYTLNDFINYYIYYYKTVPSMDIKYNCQYNVLGYPGCEINYTFITGNNFESRQYKNLELFIETNNRIYLISYNSLTETYLKYIPLVQTMLQSLEIL